MRVLLSFCLLFLVSCQSATPLRRHTYQRRGYEDIPLPKIYQAFKTVLLAEHKLRVDDPTGGLIVAVPREPQDQESTEISINFQIISPKRVEVRVSWQKMRDFVLGGQRGQELLEPQLYLPLFERVRSELAPRRPTGRKPAKKQG